jgi:hypothetical protein
MTSKSRMLQAREDADLAQKALGARERGELAAEDLDGHRALVTHILGVHDHRGPAPCRHPQESVPVGEMWGQALDDLGHSGQTPAVRL